MDRQEREAAFKDEVIRPTLERYFTFDSIPEEERFRIFRVDGCSLFGLRATMYYDTTDADRKLTALVPEASPIDSAASRAGIRHDAEGRAFVLRVVEKPLMHDGKPLTYEGLITLVALSDADELPEPDRTLRKRRIYELAADVFEDVPMIMRVGKAMTSALGASTRNKGAVYVGVDGSEYIMAGTDNFLTIDSSEGALLTTDAGTNKLLAHLNNLATMADVATGPNEVTRVTTSYEAVLSERGLPVTRKNRERVRKQLKALEKQRWTWKGKQGEVSIPISGGITLIGRDGGIVFTFSPDFMRYVMGHTAGVMALDRSLLLTNDAEFPHAFAIGCRLTNNEYMNYGKENEFRLSVRSLLKYLKGIPSHEEVASTDRAFTRRIVEPLEKNLNHLVDIGVLEHWEYCHANGEPLTDREQAARLDEDGNDTTMPYDVAIGCLIEWEPVHRYEMHREAVMEARRRNGERAHALKVAEAEEADRRERRISRHTEKAIAEARARAELTEDAPPKQQEAH